MPALRELTVVVAEVISAVAEVIAVVAIRVAVAVTVVVAREPEEGRINFLTVYIRRMADFNEYEHVTAKENEVQENAERAHER